MPGIGSNTVHVLNSTGGLIHLSEFQDSMYDTNKHHLAQTLNIRDLEKERRYMCDSTENLNFELTTEIFTKIYTRITVGSGFYTTITIKMLRELSANINGKCVFYKVLNASGAKKNQKKFRLRRHETPTISPSK